MESSNQLQKSQIPMGYRASPNEKQKIAESMLCLGRVSFQFEAAK
jgi:hypothetical protein